jgi:type I restriction enzyme S subunit
MCNRNGSSHLVGKVAKIPELNENMTFGTFMTIVRSQFHNYLFHYFQTKAFRMQIKMQTSVAINQISLPLLESVQLPLPPTEIQDLFEKRVIIIEKQKSIAQASAQKSEELFNSLLQKAFNGNLI